MVPRLETERLTVRALTTNDLNECHRLYLDTGWADKENTEEENLQVRKTWLDWTVRNYVALDRLNQPPYGDRAVELVESGRFIGLVGLVPLLAPFGQLPGFGGRKNSEFSPEVGLFWMISPSAQRHGFATEAARALVKYAFDVLKVGRIVATTESDNLASIGVMRKIGMRIERNAFPDPPWFQIAGVLRKEDRGLAKTTDIRG